jgi:lipopolysaccharide/colanic/teichoic acid biosynthesis glycosyltransferase
LPIWIPHRLVESPAVPTPVDTPSALRPRRERGPQVVAPIQPRRHRWYRQGKHVGDFVLALVLSLFAMPVMLLAALLIRLTSRGPAFYSQTRVGQHGRQFTIYKLRTMIHNCESLTGPRWSIPGDPRVTQVGRLLRLTHIDELPQLWNVLRGDMSLVGPRPERPEFIAELERALPAYWQRLSVRPGVTGLAQIQLEPDVDIECVRRKLAHDLYYIRELSPGLDVRLVAGTVLYALRVPFRVLGRMLRIPASEVIERDMKEVVGESPVLRRSA